QYFVIYDKEEKECAKFYMVLLWQASDSLLCCHSPIPLGAFQPSNGSRLLVMANPTAPPVTPRSVSHTIQNCQPRLPRMRSTPPNTTKPWRRGEEHLGRWSPSSVSSSWSRPKRSTRTRR